MVRANIYVVNNACIYDDDISILVKRDCMWHSEVPHIVSSHKYPVFTADQYLRVEFSEHVDLLLKDLPATLPNSRPRLLTASEYTRYVHWSEQHDPSLFQSFLSDLEVLKDDSGSDRYVVGYLGIDPPLPELDSLNSSLIFHSYVRIREVIEPISGRLADRFTGRREYNHVGLALLDSGNYDEALELFSAELNTHADYLAHHGYSLALFMHLQRNHVVSERALNDCIAHQEQSVNANPLCARTHFALGMMYRHRAIYGLKQLEEKRLVSRRSREVFRNACAASRVHLRRAIRLDVRLEECANQELSTLDKTEESFRSQFG